MQGAVKPEGIIVDLEQKLIQITWTDAHVSLYGFRYLRAVCPCAQCNPEVHGGAEAAIPESVKHASAEIKSVEDVAPVGAYAMTIRWADGHQYGIYDWELLRSICPCEEHFGRYRKTAGDGVPASRIDFENNA